MVSRLAGTIERRNGAGSDLRFRVPVSAKEYSQVTSLWHQAKLPVNERVIALAPGSKMQAKRWPLELYVELAKRLLEAYPGTHLLIIGGQEDCKIAEEIREKVGPRITSFAGQLTVLESAEALRRCALYVGNDSGAMHLAAAMDTKCVAIFSARDHPGVWEPYGQGHIVLRKDVSCAGCFLSTCVKENMKCLTGI